MASQPPGHIPQQVGHFPSSNAAPAPKSENDLGPFPTLLEELHTIFSSKSTNPPLGWAGIHAFEEENNIILPEPYRTFIAEIANGCKDGPAEWGLVPLTAEAIRVEPPEKRYLDRPFPLTNFWDWGNEPGLDGEELERKISSVWNHGSVFLGDDGCGMYWYLIVTGELRGHVWLLMEESALPFGEPFGYSTGGIGFYGWVVQWVEGKDWFVD